MARKDEKKSSNKGMLIIIIVLLLAVIVVGIVLGIFILNKNKSSGEPPKVVEEVLSLDEFVVNIQNPSMKKYVKFNLAITYDSKDKKILDKINTNIYKIKDGIISLFKEKSISDLQTNQGIETIKGEIKSKIDSILDGSTIIGVYFTNLLLN